MGTITGILNIKKAISNLNPEQVRRASQQPVYIGVPAHDPQAAARVREFLLSGLAAQRRSESERLIIPGQADIVIADVPSGRETQLVEGVLESHPDHAIALARAFPPFREAFAKRVINNTARENALFSLSTALPDIVPNLIELPWAVAEFASDTAFLTMNQLRMAFLLAAASDRAVGYREQKSEIATVIASAFGWRAVARQLVGKIPFGGGLIGKTAVAYAATKVVGISLNHLYSAGYQYSRTERETIYADALQNGRRVATDILKHVRPDVAEKFAKKALSKVPMVYPRGDAVEH